MWCHLSLSYKHTHNSLFVEATVVWSGDADTLTGKRPKYKKAVLELDYVSAVI